MQVPPQASPPMRLPRIRTALSALCGTALFMLGAPSSAQLAASVVQTPQVRAELVAHAPQGLVAGQPVWLGLQLTHQPHWHTYWKNPGDSGLPTQLQWTLPAGWKPGETLWPVPQKIAIGALANFGYEDTALLGVPVEISPAFAAGAADVEVRLHASWLVCRTECIPQEGDFALRIPARSSYAAHGSAFDRLLGAQPQAHGGGAVVSFKDKRLELTLDGLPPAWKEQPLAVFPETPELVDTPSVPDGRSAAGQRWMGAQWSATMELSEQRTAAPPEVPFLVVLMHKDGSTASLRAVARVDGRWPPVANPAVGTTQSAGATLPQPAPSQGGFAGVIGAVVAALVGGLILNLMPCVFPVLAIKVFEFSRHDYAPAARRLQGLAYSAGVVLSFVALGALMLALRAGGEQLGWGFQLQSPAVIASLALLFTLMAMNLAGWIDVGHWLPSGVASLQFRHPAADAFLSGVLAVAVASPCTAPFMGASLGLAITLPALQALAIFAALGVGLALPFAVASWVPAIARRMPRPGAWMETLRHFLAFPMAATVVWLVWVLGHLSGIDGAASLLTLLLAVGLLLWAAGQSGRIGQWLTGLALTVAVALALSIGPNVFRLEAVMVDTAPANTTAWQPWAPGKVEVLLAQSKPVFVDFTAAWCITCQLNKKTTLANEAVMADFAAKGVTLLRADWTRRDPAITQALQILGRSGVPVYVLYSPGRPPVVFSELLSTEAVRSALAGL